MSEWQFGLATLPDMEWVDRDVPLGDPEVIVSLSGPSSISGTLPLGYKSTKTPSGKPALVEWGTALVAEQPGRKPVFAIVDEISTEGDTLNIQAGGFTSYPSGMPWTGSQFSSTKVDPLDVVRLIWDRLQSYEGGNLGVTLDSTKSGTYLGKPEDPKLTAAKRAMDAAKARLDDAEDQAKADAIAVQQFLDNTLRAAGLSPGGLVIRSQSAPSGTRRSKRNLWLKGDASGMTAGFTWNGKKWVEISASRFNEAADWYVTWEAQKVELTKAKERVKTAKTAYSDAKSKVSDMNEGQAEPYTLSWWETHDLGTVITDLATETPFEYVESSTWNSDGTLSHHIKLGYPTLGVRRSDLKLEIGVNVTAPPPLKTLEYASQVLVLGAGEGRAMLNASGYQDLGRLRRTVVVERKDLVSKDRVESEARAEVKLRSSDWTFDTLSLVDHPMCPYGRFDVGDWLPITGDAGWTQLDRWVRVTEIQIDCTTGGLTLKVSSE